MLLLCSLSNILLGVGGVSIFPGMTLNSISVDPNTDATATVGLRDGGDLFHPEQPGVNILQCGALGNEVPSTQRLTLPMGQNFHLTSTFHDIIGNVSFRLLLLYGANPNFLLGGYFEILPVASVDSSILVYTLTRTITRDLAYNSPATIQVMYQDSRDNPDTAFVQCIDVTITGGSDVPPNQPPGTLGHGLPILPPSGPPTYRVVPTESTTRSVGAVDDSGKLKDFHIILIAFLCLLICCLLFLFCKLWHDDRENKDLAKQQQHIPMDNKPTSRPAPVEAPIPAHHQQAMPPPPAPESDEEESDDDGDMGSKGRHFHFKYVE